MTQNTTTRIDEINAAIAQYNATRMSDRINDYRRLARSWGLSLGRCSKEALVSALLPEAEKLLIEKATLAAAVQPQEEEKQEETPTEAEPVITDADLDRAARIIEDSTGKVFYLVSDRPSGHVEYRCDYQEADGDKPAVFRCTCWSQRDAHGLCEHLRIALAASADWIEDQLTIIDRTEHIIHNYGAIVGFSVKEGIGTYHSVYLHPGKPEQDRCTCRPVQADGSRGLLCDHLRKAREWEEQYHHERAVYGATVALS